MFHTTTGTPLDKGNVLRGFYRLLKRSDVPRVKFHSLRVTSNSLLIEAGADPVEIAARMGHASTRMTLDVNARQFSDRGGRLATMMDTALGQNSPNSPRTHNQAG